jgi:Na+-driven multidrug efflux pump
VSGLAWSSVLSTAIGYTITLSHFFSKKRTVSPDFSVVRDRKEFLTYVTWDVRLGSSATLDEVMSSVALTLQTTTVGTIGGAGGLAIWAVYKSVRGVILSTSNGVAASVSVHAGLLFGQGDYDGVRYSVKEGALLAQAI